MTTISSITVCTPGIYSGLESEMFTAGQLFTALALFNRRLPDATFYDKQSTRLVFLARQAGDLLVTEFGVR